MTEFRTVFEVAASPSEAWASLEDLQRERGDLAATPRRWWLPGFEGHGTELAAVEHQLTVQKDDWPCPGTTIAITIEHVGSGSRITVVQSGFDEAFVRAAGEGFWIVSEQIAADLRLFFETGVLGGRHARPWTMLGWDGTSTATGVQITSVAADTWAERVGLLPGDTLLTLAGAPVTGMRDAVTVQRIVQRGDDLAATWARDGKHHEATAGA